MRVIRMDKMRTDMTFPDHLPIHFHSEAIKATGPYDIHTAGKLLYTVVTINCPCDWNKIITLGLCGMNEMMIIIAEFSISHLRLTWLERSTSLWFWNPPIEIWVSSQQLMANQTGYSFKVTTNIPNDKRCMATQRILEIATNDGWMTERQSPSNYKN